MRTPCKVEKKVPSGCGVPPESGLYQILKDLCWKRQPRKGALLTSGGHSRGLWKEQNFQDRPKERVRRLMSPMTNATFTIFGVRGRRDRKIGWVRRGRRIRGKEGSIPGISSTTRRERTGKYDRVSASPLKGKETNVQ